MMMPPPTATVARIVRVGRVIRDRAVLDDDGSAVEIETAATRLGEVSSNRAVADRQGTVPAASFS